MAKDDKKKDDGAKADAKAELSPEDQAKAKKKKLILFGAVGALVLAGVGGGAAFFLAGGGEKDLAAKAGEHQDGAAPDGAPASDHAGANKGEHKDGADHAAKDGEAPKKDEGAHGKEEGKKDDGGHAEPKKDDGGHAEPKKEGGGSKKKDDKDKDASNSRIEGVDFGCTHNFQPFNMNLGNPLENRFIRLELAVEFGCGDEQKAEIEKRMPQLRDAVIAVTTRKQREFLLSPDGKDHLRKEIHTRLNGLMTKKIDSVFITDILIE